MSTLSFTKELKNKEITEKNARTIANEFIKIWHKNQGLASQLFTQLINKYKNSSCLLLLILQVFDEELIKWRIDDKCNGLHEFIVTVLVNQFITEWIDYYNCNQSILVEDFITEQINNNIQPTESYQDFDKDRVPFLIWIIESARSRDDEYTLDQDISYYNFKEDFCDELKKKLEENQILQKTIQFKYSENCLLFDMSLRIEVRKLLLSNIITNDNLNRSQYDPNIIVHNLSMFTWFSKMNKSLPPVIKEYIIKNWVL
jgi:hypothetical protein